jgi:uncharacterized protein YeaO (DUF488 family)
MTLDGATVSDRRAVVICLIGRLALLPRSRKIGPTNMSIHIVRLGSPRLKGEGVRLGTVRRPPRGVPKSKFAAQNWYDVWFPNLAPSLELMKQGLRAQSEADWRGFARKYRREMAAPHAQHDLALLAALSHSTNFSVGCYCEHEERCHRSLLRSLLIDAGAQVHRAAPQSETAKP